ncbi:murein hydrolase activator EnvC family protein [Novosphingobium album (ex Hu et al. 2023)]|uniref:Peptidoglycan DD-metalloendopeptidase family protein n=1 Tax=Novosphingobium album (ex Hu et al. 2023) TaxID=2930093 RepID=A0ABT0B465_9SPHN|nr:peptidoglycan DD-metalloendopeptidase family protein [Novosphingobium album (ex Hu et al. 2023)]MCJ2179845.1 peptidoglycan DD-metalloendopeptidase family protein [Novosphingobium album (ex Hu et al. 2023)]
MKLSTRLALILAACATAVLVTQAMTQQGALAVLDPTADASKAQEDMRAARREGEAARKRAEKLEARARNVTVQAEKTAREAAAVAARIQETEAALAVQQARIRLIASQRAQLRAALAEQQEPLVRLTGSLQRLSRRSPLLALLRPGSVRDAVYMRALLDTVLPEVQARTADLRAEIERGRALERSAQAATADLGRTETEMRARRQKLASIEAGQRLASRQVAGIAARESDRALALAEKARDLGELVAEMGRQGELRDRLAALPGPIMRPARPESAQVVETVQFTPPPEGLPSYMLPVTGRLVTGFGEVAPGQARSGGLVLAPRANAQVVSPAPGRVAFAGPYRGYHRIIIIEHAGGWTSLVTGLARLDVAVGDNVVAGSPVGMTGPGTPQVVVELRRDGEPVNPLQYIRSL